MTRSAEVAARDGADASHAARSGAVQVLTILAQALIAATQVVFAHLYGKAIYGSYLSALAVMEVLCRGGAAGADKAMLRYVSAFRAAGDPAGVRSAIGTGLRLSLMVAGTFVVALALGAPLVAAALDEAPVTQALRILAPLPLLTGALWILIQASLAARTTRANFYVRGIAEPSLLLIGGVTAWLLGSGLRGLATAHVVSYIVTVTLAVLVVRRGFRQEETIRWLAAPRLRGFARFSLPIAAADMLNAVVQRADILILTMLKGAEAAALYGAAEMMTRSIANVRYAFDSIVAGVLSETWHLGQLDRLRYNLALVTRWVVSVAAPITVTIVVLRHDLLAILFDSSYGVAAGALAILALNHFVNASLGLTGWVLMVAGRSRLGLINNMVAVAFNLPAAYFLTVRFGIVGAACAALGTSLILQGMMLLESTMLERVHPFSAALLKPLGAAIITVVVEITLNAWIGPAWVRVPAVVLAGVVVYGLALLVLGLPEEERRIFARVVQTARGRFGGARS